MKVVALLVVAICLSSTIAAPQEPSFKDKLLAKAEAFREKLQEALEAAKGKAEELANLAGQKREEALAKLENMREQLETKLKNEIIPQLQDSANKAKHQATQKLKETIEATIEKLKDLEGKLSQLE